MTNRERTIYGFFPSILRRGSERNAADRNPNCSYSRFYNHSHVTFYVALVSSIAKQVLINISHKYYSRVYSILDLYLAHAYCIHMSIDTKYKWREISFVGCHPFESIRAAQNAIADQPSRLKSMMPPTMP